jgi:ribulose-5-phosphate 4-epimerase/fuculose-1-phosphate aldolase
MKSFIFTPAAEHYIADVALVAGFLWERGWAVKNSGNISVDMSGKVDIPASELSLFPFKPLDRAYLDLFSYFFYATNPVSHLKD